MIHRRALAGLGLCAIGAVWGLCALIFDRTPSIAHLPAAATDDRLALLRSKAEAGDNEARMDLSVLLGDSGEGMLQLVKAAADGHPPAIVAIALGEINAGSGASMVTRSRVEALAMKGYYPAILLLTTCLADGHCGPSSPAEAYMWSLVSHRLVDAGKLQSNQLTGYEAALRHHLDASQADAASRRAASIAAKIEQVAL
jgi:hypothetical protein